MVRPCTSPEDPAAGRHRVDPCQRAAAVRVGLAALGIDPRVAARNEWRRGRRARDFGATYAGVESDGRDCRVGVMDAEAGV
jgi:hypothetical protein